MPVALITGESPWSGRAIAVRCHRGWSMVIKRER